MTDLIPLSGNADWLAGAADFDVTPPLGVSMTGYAGRPGPASHVLDRLHVRALALATVADAPIVLTGADLLGIGPEMVARIRERVAHLLAPERVLLNHSHTHAGPTTAPLRAMGEADPAYCDLLVRWTVAAIEEALRVLQPARLAFGTAETAIGRNRRALRDGRIVLGDNPAGPYDASVSVLRVDDRRGYPLACWFSHGTHPVVMGNQNTGLSAEWPGAASATLSALLGCPAVFAQGCCGDVNPVRRGDHAVAVSVGRELAGGALIAWERAEPVASLGIGAALRTARLPQQRPSREAAEAAAAEARERLDGAEKEAASLPEPDRKARLDAARVMAAWAQDYQAAAQAPGDPSVEMDVQAFRIGDVGIVGTAAETFVSIGRQLRALSPLERTVSLGYTNGCVGYLPTEDAFAHGGYEVETAYRYYGTLMLTPDCERLTLTAGERALGEAIASGGVRPGGK